MVFNNKLHIDYSSSIINYLKNLVKHIRRPGGRLGISLIGHKNYIGGEDDFEDYGKKLFESLLKFKIKPNSVTFDIGCGCLRIGKHLINYLDKEKYYGLEPEEELIKYALKSLVSKELIENKNPKFVSNYCFDLSEFKKKAQFVIINSIFTHLNKKDVHKCLSEICRYLDVDGKVIATFSKTKRPQIQILKSHNHRNFFYTIDEMEQIGKYVGLKTNYLGNNWGHPRNQDLIIFTKM